jgi:hypothetical protein
MNAIQRKATTVPARVAAPFPIAEKTTLATTIVGTVSRLGSHESRHPGMRRNASARISGAASVAAPVTPDSSLCACECHESLLQAVSIPRQSRRKKPSSKAPAPATSSAAAPSRPSTSGLSARQSPSASTITRRPVRFAPIRL